MPDDRPDEPNDPAEPDPERGDGGSSDDDRQPDHAGQSGTLGDRQEMTKPE